MAACLQHTTASLIHFTRCHNILQGRGIPKQNHLKGLIDFFHSNEALLRGHKFGEDKTAVVLEPTWQKTAAWRVRDRKDSFGGTLCEEKRKTRSSPRGVIVTPNLSSLAWLWIIPRQLWEALKWWKSMYLTWHYSQTSALSLPAPWESAGLRHTWRELSSKMAA